MAERGPSRRERIVRLWQELSTWKQILVLSTPYVAFLVLCISAELTLKPQKVTLVSSADDVYLGEVTQYLDANGYAYRYKLKGNSILVDARVRDEIRVGLATAGIASVIAEP